MSWHAGARPAPPRGALWTSFGRCDARRVETSWRLDVAESLADQLSGEFPAASRVEIVTAVVTALDYGPGAQGSAGNNPAAAARDARARLAPPRLSAW